MKPERYFDLFKKYIKGSIDVFGIILIPESLSEDGVLNIRLENPQDLPYNRTALEGYVNEEFNNFNAFVGEFYDLSNFKLFAEELYLSDEFLFDIQKTLSDIKVLKSPNNTRIVVNHKKFKVNKEGHRNGIDGIHIINYVTMNMKVKSDKEKLFYKYVKGFSGRFDEHEINYLSVDDVMDKYPTLIDNDYQYSYVTTELL